MKFPEGFLFGYATSSFQIEGGVRDGGRRDSVWDTFCRQPGAILDGSNADTACDHFHRWNDDLDLLGTLGAGAYLFSTAWPRIMPEGRPNPEGLDFYSRIVDGLLERGIEPWIKLYHWDLPQSLEEKGGWLNRDTAFRFADYAEAAVRKLGDRVSRWISHNEPWCVSMMGYHYGEFAPGCRNLKEALQVAHHLLLSHGLAAEPVKSLAAPGALYGYAPNYLPAYPATDRGEDRAAARRFMLYFNDWFIDPVYGLEYPAELVDYYGDLMPVIGPDDMRIIAVRPDFLGINYYNANRIKDAPGGWKPETENVPMPGVWHTADREVFPRGLADTLRYVNDRYQPGALYITENGAAVADPEPKNGNLSDPDRIRFFREHLTVAGECLAEGIPLKGYFAWSLMDNFEWNKGYTLRYGVTHVDFVTQKRTIKESGRFLAGVYRSGILP